MTPALPKPRLYIPFADGRYTVTARLRPLTTEPHFQVDARYVEYIREKARNHRDARTMYHHERGLAPALARAIAAFALRTLPAEYPEAFAVTLDDAGATFENKLLGLTLDVDLAAGRVLAQRRGPAQLTGGDAVHAATDFTALSLLEALALQTQEDWAVVARDPETRADVTAALHVSFPSHWRPEDKIGRSFVGVHAPIPGIDPLLKAAPSLIDTMITQGPWEHFTWTLPRYPHLDEHTDVVQARGKAPVPKAADAGKSAWLRVERQVIQGFPEADGALFMIRLHIVPLDEVLRAEPSAAGALASAIRSKTAPQRAYMALDDWHEPLLTFLDGLVSPAPPR